MPLSARTSLQLAPRIPLPNPRRLIDPAFSVYQILNSLSLLTPLRNKAMSNDINILDSLLDSNLEDLADAPTWQEYPAGVHRVTVTEVEQFKVEGNEPKAGIKIKFKGIETIEAQDPEKVITPEQVTS